MSGNKHLLDNFSISQETKDYATSGSGRAVGGFTTGLPAACVLLAVERRNTGEITAKAAQAASCLKPKDFTRVYEFVKAAVEQAERDTCITYDELHKKYKLEDFAEFLDPWITRTEDKLVELGYEDDQTTRCAVYFWVSNAIKPKALPATATFSKSHELSFKSFVALVEVLNQHESVMKKDIQTTFKATLSHQKNIPSLHKHFAARRSSRISNTTALLQAATPSSTPRKRQNERSPTKVAQPTPLRLLPGRKVPLRELPSKDTPKKRPIEDSETPTKKPRTEPVFTPIPIAPPTSTPLRLPAFSSPRKKAQTIPLNSLPEPSRSSPPKFNNVIDAPMTSEDESEPDEPIVRRRFRPVYLEHKQWYAKDPRLERKWKKLGSEP
ncbi:hypothetical protein BJ912DRAFT_996366 [Pholiota molesta]|nr:hypothetical protein BJ912DRAFT_996366 [Pholiota molesta]